MKAKFRNPNCPYALVGSIVFPSIRAAESYCTAHDIPLYDIESDDPRVLAKCKQIAAATLPTLKEIQDNFRAVWNTVSDEVHEKVKQRNRAVEKGDLLSGLYERYAAEAAGKSNGFYSCMVLLYPYIDTLERVLRM